MSQPLSINITRLQREIDELALISENPPPVVTRVLFGEADLRARAFVKNLCVEAGLKLREDAVGNIFARLLGKFGMYQRGFAVCDGVANDGVTVGHINSGTS